MRKAAIAVRILECCLLIIDWSLTVVCVVLLSLGMIKMLYITEFQHFWGRVLQISLLTLIIGFVIAILQGVLVNNCDPADVHKIFPVEKCRRKISARVNCAGTILIAGAVASTVFAYQYMGGDSRHFTGDPWWKVAEEWPFILSILTGFLKGIEKSTWSKIMKREHASSSS